MFRLVLVACAVLFLAACSSGGGKGSGPAVPVADPDPAPALTPPTFSNASILPTLTGVVQRSDTITVSNVFSRISGDSTPLSPTSCSRTYCDNDYLLPSLVEIQQHGLNPDFRYSGVGEKSGVRLFQAQGRRDFVYDPLRASRATESLFRLDSTTYGAWLDYSSFWVSRTRYEEFRGHRDLHFMTGTSVGNDTGTLPTGNATWRGIMVGGTDVNGPVQAIRGDASLSYKVGSNVVDVTFTNIQNLDTRASLSDVRWVGMGVRSDGLFGGRWISSDNDRTIMGRFYGPGHAEVGGVFSDNHTVGAYGAKRQ